MQDSIPTLCLYLLVVCMPVAGHNQHHPPCTWIIKIFVLINPHPPGGYLITFQLTALHCWVFDPEDRNGEKEIINGPVSIVSGAL